MSPNLTCTIAIRGKLSVARDINLFLLYTSLHIALIYVV
jgi:hypothetical protein